MFLFQFKILSRRFSTNNLTYSFHHLPSTNSSHPRLRIAAALGRGLGTKSHWNLEIMKGSICLTWCQMPYTCQYAIHVIILGPHQMNLSIVNIYLENTWSTMLHAYCHIAHASFHHVSLTTLIHLTCKSPAVKVGEAWPMGAPWQT